MTSLLDASLQTLIDHHDEMMVQPSTFERGILAFDSVHASLIIGKNLTVS